MRAAVLDEPTKTRAARIAGLALALLTCLALAQACDCAGPAAPPGTSSYFCTCECGVFFLGRPVPDETRLSPRFEVCLAPDDVPNGRRLFARDVVELCDRACAETISSAVREVGCIDRPDLCAEIACSDDVCRSATSGWRDVFVPEPSDGGTVEVPDAALLAFGFADDCRAEGPDAGLLPCDEVPCAMADVRGVAVCGDGVLQTDEECDGICNTFGNCAQLSPGTSGAVHCADDCTYNLSGCVAPGVVIDAGPAPDRDGCVEKNALALQDRVLDVLHGCTVIEPTSTDGQCEREPSAPLCLTR